MVKEKTNEGILRERDLALIESFTSKLSGDLAEAIGRGFAGMEDRIDAAETRIYCRLAEIESRVVDGVDAFPR